MGVSQCEDWSSKYISRVSCKIFEQFMKRGCVSMVQRWGWNSSNMDIIMVIIHSSGYDDKKHPFT